MSQWAKRSDGNTISCFCRLWCHHCISSCGWTSPSISLQVCLPPVSVYFCSRHASSSDWIMFYRAGFIRSEPFLWKQTRFCISIFWVLLMSKTRWKKHFWRFSSYYYFLTRFFFLNFLFLLRIVCCCFRVKRDILNIFSLSLLLLFSETKRGK